MNINCYHKTLFGNHSIVLTLILIMGISTLPKLAKAEGNETFFIHYFRYDGKHKDAQLWVWDGRYQNSPEDAQVNISGTDEYGVYFEIDPSNYGNDNGSGESIGFIPRLYESWDHKDGSDRFWTPSLGRHIWLIGLDQKIYTSPPDISPKIFSAKIDALNKITMLLSQPVSVDELILKNFSLKNTDGEKVPLKEVKLVEPENGHAQQIELYLTTESYDILLENLTVYLEGYKSTKVQAGKVLFDKDIFYTDEPLGKIIEEDKITFRIFAPTAYTVDVVLYDNPTGNEGRRVVSMSKKGKGVWEVSLNEDLEGKHYMLAVKTSKYQQPREIYDPHVINTTGHDGRARITNIRKTDPPGFREMERPEFSGRPTDAVIYEIHIRDFTISKDSGVKNKGLYKGFVESGTTHPDDESIKTGIDHLVEMGVTHVQILPPSDFDNQEPGTEYNWGYMTNFFNSPEGMFATEIRGDARIREFKEMIKGLHRAGIRVNLDMVYNHTAPPNTFEAVAPGYYHRLKADGSFYNGSGCGNEFHSESPMGRQFIIDSCKFWVEEYKVDGFRFDLMGLVDLETMVQLRKELDKIDPTIMLYGEPWTAGGHGIPIMTDKNRLRGTKVGAFNDHFRNALKGDTDGDQPGYVQNGSQRDGVINGIKGAIDDWATNPYQSINYATCHDNLTLWDKLDKSTDVSIEERTKMQNLAAGILAVSQGILFYHAGVEMHRTKYGEHNSYNAGDHVNEIKWDWKKEFADSVAYHQAMIEIRKQHPLFRLATADEVRERVIFTFEDLPHPDTLVFRVDGRGVEGESWETALVLINPTPDDLTFNLPVGGAGDLYAIGMKAQTTPIKKVTSKLAVPGRSMALIGFE